MIQEGIAEYAMLKLSFMDGKTQLNRPNIFFKAFSCYTAHKDEIDGASLCHVLAYMINKCDCMFSATLIMASSGQMRRAAAEAYWYLATGGFATPELIAEILYLTEYYRSPPGHRAPDRAFDIPGPPFTIQRPAAQVPLGDYEPVDADVAPVPVPAPAPTSASVSGESSGEVPGGVNTSMTRLDRIMEIARRPRGKQPADPAPAEDD